MRNEEKNSHVDRGQARGKIEECRYFISFVKSDNDKGLERTLILFFRVFLGEVIEEKKEYVGDQKILANIAVSMSSKGINKLSLKAYFQEVLKNIKKHSPNRLNFLYLQGRIHDYLDEFDAAKECYSQYIERKDKGQVLAYYRRGGIFNRQEDYNLAIKDFNAAIAQEENFAPAYFSRACAYYKKKDFKSAASDYKESLNLRYQVSCSTEYLVTIYYSQKNLRAQEEVFKQGLKLEH